MQHVLDTPTATHKCIIPGIIGNILEWYDFSLYGYLAPIFAKLFFPAGDFISSLLATFGVFAAGFLMRPLGAILFGYYGDKYGRKKSLAAAIVLMAIPTTIIGMLPTYASIGIFASILLTLCRLLQGLAVGGEFSGSIIYVTEHSPANRRGFYGSWAMFSAMTGLLLGSAVGATINRLPTHALESWGFRVPFVIGLLLGVIGLYLRLYMPETPPFLAAQQNNQTVKNPILESLQVAIKPMLKVAGLMFLPSMSFYLLFVYMPTYMSVFLHVSLHNALSINTLSMITIIVLIPWVGLLSDIFGRKIILYIGAFSFLIFSKPLFNLLQQNNFESILFVQECFAIFICFAYAAVPATLVELIATPLRYTAMSFPYNVSSAIFGGTAPLVATYLIARFHCILMPSYYLIAASLVMLSVVVSLN